MCRPPADATFIVRTRDIASAEKEAIKTALGGRFGEVTELRFEVVGPVVGGELTSKAVIAVAAACVMILLYLWWAFRQVDQAYRYGTCAIIALAHDVLVVLGVWAILGRVLGFELDALFVTAILTVVGYSVHDTIVVFRPHPRELRPVPRRVVRARGELQRQPDA